MKVRRAFAGAAFSRRSRIIAAALQETAADAAAKGLQDEIARYDRTAISISAAGTRRIVRSSGPGDAAREFGTHEIPASPWLAPVLPLALEPMRAAAHAAVARAVSALDRRKK